MEYIPSFSIINLCVSCLTAKHLDNFKQNHSISQSLKYKDLLYITRSLSLPAKNINCLNHFAFISLSPCYKNSQHILTILCKYQ